MENEGGNGASGNGAVGNGGGLSAVRGEISAAPARIAELAEACVRFVERALGVKLDFEPETLSLLDHYLETARADASQRPEALVLVAHAAGAYFGEVLRRRHASWWRTDGDDPTYFRVELEEVFLAVSPMQLVAESLVRGDEDAPARSTDPDEDAGVGIEMDEEDREAVKARLADLPPVSDAEFYAPSTRLEVIDIVVDAIRSRRLGSGAPMLRHHPRDYDSD